MNQWKEENDRRKYFMKNLHDSMGGDRIHDPWISDRISYQLHYGPIKNNILFQPVNINWIKIFLQNTNVQMDLIKIFQSNRQQTKILHQEEKN